ncbi:MAG: glycoside hydrolase family 127 protein [Acidimicrobiales bacterium]
MPVTLADAFWAPRVAQLRATTIPTILANLEAQGVVDNFRRLTGAADVGHRALHFADSDLYKWVEAAVLAGRTDLAAPVVDLIEAVQSPDGYLHTYYGTEGQPGRYTDLDYGHEHYCAGHLIEAAIAHHEVTGSDQLLDVAVRLADHLLATFGPGRDERVDDHPEVEVALARLASTTGRARYLDHARWTVEQQVNRHGGSLATHRLGGHAVRSLYLASGITEVALATGDAEWVDAAARLFSSMVDEHAYPTGAVGARWLEESVGRPYEQPDAASYTESCAAVAAVHLSERIWRLTRDPRALDQIEVLLYNAVPCGVGADGDRWFYSQPHAVDAVVGEVDPWAHAFDYGASMLLAWFPARRHRWFLVPCCPPNLARMFATVDRHVAEVDDAGDLLVHLPLAARITEGGWDVEVASAYPDDGHVAVTVRAAPSGRSVRVRAPGWGGGDGHVELPADGQIDLPVAWTWWETDHRVEGAAGSVHLRRGPVVHCVEGVDLDGVDPRDLVVDPTRPPAESFSVRAPSAHRPLHRPVGALSVDVEPTTPVAVGTVPYAEWANRGTTTMRLRFPTR